MDYGIPLGIVLEQLVIPVAQIIAQGMASYKSFLIWKS